MLPLDDLRVLDLSRHLPGPFCSLLLADLGADTIKIEDTHAGDPLRWMGESLTDRPGVSAVFAALNRNKRSVQLDLKTVEGREQCLRLVGSADVVIDSFRPGVMDRLGLGYKQLQAANQRVIYCPISGYGQQSALHDRPGHDLNFIARSGLLALTGTQAGPPVIPAGQVADIGGSFMAAFAILAALRERDRTGHGRLIDIALADAGFPWLALIAAGQLAGGPTANRGDFVLAGSVVCYRVYRCADNRWVALAALEEKFWRIFCEGVDRLDLLEKRFDHNSSETAQTLEMLFAQRTRAQWEEFSNHYQCCLDPVFELDEALAVQKTLERQLIVTFDEASQQFTTLGSFAGLGLDQTAFNRLPAPMLGEHTISVLAQL